MGGAVGPALAAAVSNAGGLGTLALWGADIEALRRQVRETRALTSKPFAVNLNLEFPQQERLDACLQEGVPIISSWPVSELRSVAPTKNSRELDLSSRIFANMR